MYIPPAFKSDEEKAWACVEARGFGLVTAVDDGWPVASPLPFHIDRSGRTAKLQVHMPKANPLAAVLARAPNVLIAVSGPDAYISPDWYPTPEQVPTWNYVAVHLRGTARVLPDTQMRDVVERISDQFEARLLPKPIWKSSKVPPARMEMLLRMLVAIEIDVQSVEGKWKLSQNKSPADRLEAARMLQWRGDWNARELGAEMMRSLEETGA